MELRWMRTFMAVAEELNYGRAAQRLHLTQPAVSQQIRQLEKDVGVELVDRSGRSTQLTPAGEGFLPHCITTLRAADNAVRAARNMGDNDRGVVRIGFAGALATSTVADIARAVRQQYPGIELRITASHSSAGVMELLQADTLDIGFTALQRTVPGISSRRMTAQPVGLVVASDHPAAAKSSVRLSDFSDAPFILTDLTAGLQLRDVAIEACVDAGFRPRVVQETPDTLTQVALVAAGVGIAILPERFAVPASENLAFLPLEDVDRRVETLVAWRSARPFGAQNRVLAVIDNLILR